MSENGSTEVGGAPAGDAKTRTPANIVRGTLPHPLVYLIRFDEKDAKDADVAKKYGTTTGKVADIKKNRNFGYIDESYVPTKEAKEAAISWLKKVPGYDEVGTDSAVTAVERMNTASDADVEALKAKRAEVRAKNEASGGEKPAKQPKAPKGEKGAPSKASAKDAASLMS